MKKNNFTILLKLIIILLFINFKIANAEILLIAKDVAFNSVNKKFEIDLTNVKKFKEIRLFINSSNNCLDKCLIKVSAYSMNKLFFDEEFNPSKSGVTIPLSDRNIKIKFLVKPVNEEMIVSIYGNYRENSFYNSKLSKNNLKFLDNRFNEFYDQQAIIKNLYGENYKINNNLFILFFDYLNEMEDLISSECKIIFKNTLKSSEKNRKDLISNLRKAQFMFGLKIENLELPQIELYENFAYITVKKKMRSTDVKGKWTENEIIFHSKMKVELKKNHLVISEIIREYSNDNDPDNIMF